MNDQFVNQVREAVEPNIMFVCENIDDDQAMAAMADAWSDITAERVGEDFMEAFVPGIGVVVLDDEDY